MTALTANDVSELTAPSKRYPEADYKAIIDALQKTKKQPGKGNVEEQFPGVKPAHVAFMLKRLLPQDAGLAVTTHATLGVCLYRVPQQPTTALETAAPAVTPAT